MAKPAPQLKDAYALKTPDDSRRLYADWARDYDKEFARKSDYRLHIHTARTFADAGGTGPVLDVGAGTGLCGEVLVDLGIGPIDAADISGEMLAIAMRKDIYRDAVLTDLEEGVPVPIHSYGGVVSSGTFTTGHVGPDAIDNLLPVARTGALFALSINAEHYESAGFEAKFDSLRSKISEPLLVETPIYGPNALGDHKDDIAFIALFRTR
jgi:SAM-dependent methyltransferase